MGGNGTKFDKQLYIWCTLLDLVYLAMFEDLKGTFGPFFGAILLLGMANPAPSVLNSEVAICEPRVPKKSKEREKRREREASSLAIQLVCAFHY